MMIVNSIPANFEITFISRPKTLHMAYPTNAKIISPTAMMIRTSKLSIDALRIVSSVRGKMLCQLIYLSINIFIEVYVNSGAKMGV